MENISVSKGTNLGGYKSVWYPNSSYPSHLIPKYSPNQKFMVSI